MSVVGPRAVWTDEEVHLEEETAAWRKRWFIKPGLTGLAQINEATSAEAEAKLGYDLQYIRQQSFWFDLKIVVRQLWGVGQDLVWFMLPWVSDEEKEDTAAHSNRTADEANEDESEGTETGEAVIGQRGE